jgi:hypothetical protein
MVLELPEMGIDAWFRTGAQQDELGALVQAAEDSVMDEVHPLLRVQAAHVGHEGLVVVAQPLSLAQGAGIVGLGTEVPRCVVARNGPVGLWVPHVVIEAIELHRNKFGGVTCRM